MEIEKDFMEILTYNIAPIIKECIKNKHQLNNIKVKETLRSLEESNKIDTYNMYSNGSYLYVMSKKYIQEIGCYHFYSCAFITALDQYVVFDISKIYIGKYITPIEFSRICIKIPKFCQTPSNISEES